jgi:uncharacterized protein YkwD/LysM repeat protein
MLLFFLIYLSTAGARASSYSVQLYSNADELLTAVNSIRSSNGLPAYHANSILMSISQSQADYEQSIGVQTDNSADGLRAYQRALAAGYPVAGNVTTSVGYLSELLYGGVNVSAQEAVQWWFKDAGHKPYLMSSLYQDIGAGVAQSNNTFYYVIVIALSTGGTPVPYTPPAPRFTAGPTIIPNTPNADGSIIHIIQPGDTLGAIAEAYDVSLSNLLSLNGLTLTSKIYAGNKLIIRASFTPTATQPTSTPTRLPTITAWPTSTPTFTVTPPLPTSTPSPGLPVSAGRSAVLTIVVISLVVSLLIALVGRKRN